MAGEATLAPRRATGKAVADRPDGAQPGAPTDLFQIVLKPLSHPELAEIGIDETLFPVGRNEPPFDGYPADAVADLSRRHARIFCENGVIHIADMGSKNGTAVNGVDLRQKTARLQQGDELQFGRSLKFQVQLRAHAPVPVARLLSLTLLPADETAGLQPIIVTQFPFLISKADAAFARYRDAHAQQVNFLSRRHAHVFLKRGLPQVEDLGSTNGTFVNGRRLDEHATALEEGDTVGFGGRFFVYRVVLQKEEALADPTLTRYTGIPMAEDAARAGAPVMAYGPMSEPMPMQGTVPMQGTAQAMRFDIDRTTFIGAPNSFLEIFCVDNPPAPDQPDPGTIGAAGARDAGGRREPVFDALPAAGNRTGSGHDGGGGLRSEGRAGTGSGSAAAATGAAHPGGVAAGAALAGSANVSDDSSATGRRAARTKTAAADGRKARGQAHGRTVTGRPRSQLMLVAGQVTRLLSAADRTRLKRIATAGGAGLLLAIMLAVAAHLSSGDEREIRTLVAAGSFEQATRAADRHLAQYPDDLDVRQLATQAWLKAYGPRWLAATAAGDLVRAAAVVASMRAAAQHDADAPALLRELEWIGELDRFVGPGAERPIRIDADEGRIAALLEQWDADASGHQRAAAVIATNVPAFREAYAAALSRLRRLQGDSAVYLAAIERFRSTVATQLDNEHPETVGALVHAYAEKYPRLVGLDRYDADMQRYLRLRTALQDGRLGTVVAEVERMQFDTAVFQARLRALAATRRLPDAELTQRYRNLRSAWRAGQAERATTALQGLATGAWGAGAAAELRHKNDVVATFKALGSGVGTPGHAERLLAFHDLLDAEEDAYFLHAVQADPAGGRTRLLQRADARVQQAASLLQQYRQAGLPDDAARRDDSSGAGFAAQLRMLAQARAAGLQAERLYRLLGAPVPAAAQQRLGEILVEASAQRNALRDARPPLPPALLGARLALLDASDVAGVPLR